MMKSVLFYKTKILYFLFLFTLIALAAYSYLPQKQLQIFPSDNTFASLNNFAAPKDLVDITWVDQASTSWQCNITTTNNHLCGVHLQWQQMTNDLGINFSGYEYIKLNLSYQGSGQNFRVFARNYNSKYSNKNDGNSSQYLYTTFNTRTLINNEINIYLSTLTVADWWLENYQHPRKYSHPSFTNITALGVEVFGKNITGLHRIKINSMVLVGPWFSQKYYYLAILSLWLITTFIFLSYQLTLANKKTENVHKQGQKLAIRNEKLSIEKEKYKTLSSIDALTQIPNRHGFHESTKSAFFGNNQQNVSLCLIDIDYFKHINDTYGHDVGDNVLKQIARLLQENIRNDDLFARWGGEEFIICSNETNANDTYKFGEKLRRVIEDTKFIKDSPLKITISLGIAVKHVNESFKDCLKRADKKLYQAKNEGRNKTII